jgi:streptomycin 6-kinase
MQRQTIWALRGDNLTEMVAELDLPVSLRERLVGRASSLGRGDMERWLADLPDVVGTLAERWELTMGAALPSSSSYVAAADRDSGEACILKIGAPVRGGTVSTAREARALRAAGPAAARLLEEDIDAGALLLARATGPSLEKLCERDDDLATEILASAMVSFQSAAGTGTDLPPLSVLEDTFEEFDRGPHGASYRGRGLADTLAEIDSGLRDLRKATATARRVLQELLADKVAAVVLHGDLHHRNVLADDQKGWVVIDPKGFSGAPAYDVGALLYNPRPFPARLDDVETVVRRRLAVMSGVVAIDQGLLAAWGYVGSVLSLLWSLEDGGDLDRHDVRMYTVAALRKLI